MIGFVRAVFFLVAIAFAFATPATAQDRITDFASDISIAENGTLYRGLTPAVLRKELKARFNVEADRSAAAVWRVLKTGAQG